MAGGTEIPEGPFVPQCDENGFYVSMQCYWDDCWCVTNPHGNEVEGTRVPGYDRDTLACDEEPGKMPPSKVEHIYIPPQQMIGEQNSTALKSYKLSYLVTVRCAVSEEMR